MKMDSNEQPANKEQHTTTVPGPQGTGSEDSEGKDHSRLEVTGDLEEPQDIFLEEQRE